MFFCLNNAFKNIHQNNILSNCYFKIKTCICTQHSNFREINHTRRLPAAYKLQDSIDLVKHSIYFLLNDANFAKNKFSLCFNDEYGSFGVL